MPIDVQPFDAADYLRTEDDADFFLNDAKASGDPAVVAAALAVVERARRSWAARPAGD